MRRKLNWLLSVLVIIFLAVSTIVTASMLIPSNDKAKENSNAPENSPVIDEDWGLERVDFIHYVKPTNPARGPKTTACYKLMGVKWKTLSVDYTINPDNPQSLSESFVTSTISVSAETWDSKTSSELFNNSYNVNNNSHYGTQDFVNVIDFGDYPNDGVIAVTSVWYTPIRKQIVEFDMRFNTRFNWGDAISDSSKMDLQNIATHELGHGVGLSDIYSSACAEVTMYGYSTEGETKKRSLEQPDITGLQEMYGT